MFRSWKLGRAFGIPLFVHPTFLLLPLFVLFHNRALGPVTALVSVAVVLATFGCVLLHELGHALAARYFGIRTLDVTLYPIGGVARLSRGSERPHEELAIALAGPAVNVIIAALLTPFVALALVGGVLPQDAVLTVSDGPLTVFAWFGFGVWVSNIFLVVFNLIPAFPMDGGRVLRAILAAWLGQLRATDIAGRLGLVVAMLMAVAGVWTSNPFLVVISLFVAFVGQQERLAVRYQEARRRAAGGPVTVGPVAEVAAARPAGFSGVAWDATYRVWVRWVDGRPVGYYAPAE
jgi:Zn-dependent protease